MWALSVLGDAGPGWPPPTQVIGGVLPPMSDESRSHSQCIHAPGFSQAGMCGEKVHALMVICPAPRVARARVQVPLPSRWATMGTLPELGGLIKRDGQWPGQGDARKTDVDPGSSGRQAATVGQRDPHRGDSDRAMPTERPRRRSGGHNVEQCEPQGPGLGHGSLDRVYRGGMRPGAASGAPPPLCHRKGDDPRTTAGVAGVSDPGP